MLRSALSVAVSSQERWSLAGEEPGDALQFDYL